MLRTFAAGIIGVVCLITVLVGSISLAHQQSVESPLTGNWAVRSSSTDGYVRTSYFHLKQEGDRITGAIRTTQFFYTIKESSGGPQGFRY